MGITYHDQAAAVVDEPRVLELLAVTRPPDRVRLEELLAKARLLEGLSLEEVAELLAVDQPEGWEAVFAAARAVKEGIYGRRMVLFAPLYISNYCRNNCLYCGFRRDNTDLVRKTLSQEEVEQEIRAMLRQGHKRTLLVAGEDPSRSGLDYLLETIRTVYSIREGKGEIRRLNVNVAPLQVEEYAELHAAGVGTYQCFQETYHRPTYAYMHPSGTKRDFDWRVSAFDRSMQGGVDDVGLGVLFGLYDYRFEVLGLVSHAAYLDREYGVGPHTISFPRLEPALNAPVAADPPYPISDEQVKQVVAILRLAVPYTGIIMSTRETPALRRTLCGLGVSQLSAGSRVHPGGYAEGPANITDEQQFFVGDTRSLDEVVRDLCDAGYLPSFCTACYRSGRTGEVFMGMAKPGEIQHFCAPNAMLTFEEYLLDYASPATREAGARCLKQHLQELPERLQQATQERLARVEAGERDVYL